MLAMFIGSLGRGTRVLQTLSVATVLLGFVYTNTRALTWTLETVDTPNRTGLMPSVAMNSSGIPFISYYDSTASDLRLGTKPGSTWSKSTVDSDGETGAQTSLVIDGSGNLHIASHKVWALRYAKRVGTTWTLTTVDTGCAVNGQFPSIAVNASGYPRIAYWDGCSGSEKYASWDGSSWSIETIQAGSGGIASLTLASDGTPHVAFDNSPMFDQTLKVRYATKSGGAWSVAVVDSFIHGPSLVLNTGNPVIACGEGTSGGGNRLRVLTKSGSTWTSEYPTDSDFFTGFYPSLRLDSSSSMRVSYVELQTSIGKWRLITGSG